MMTATRKQRRKAETLDVDDRYFLQYQKEAIMLPVRLALWEKSIRIGATFAHGYRAVRRRQLGSFGDLLHTSVNERIAKEFISDCKKFCRIFDVAGASDVNEFDVWNESENRKETAYEIHFKQQETAIKSYSSNPDAVRGAGGEVNIDELSSHKQPEEMLKAAGGRAMWGYDLRIWTSHRGENSCFNRMIKEQRALGDKARWTIRRTTLPDAIKMGLLDKINEVRGTNISEEDFIADTIALVGGLDAYEEECLCNPRAAGDAAIKWQYIDDAKETYDIYRKHIEGNESFDVAAWAADLIEILRAADAVAVGYDVARTGHLSAVPIIARAGDVWWLRALITMHKRKFGLQRAVIETLMHAVPAMVGAGDSTGLGMQVCEELTDCFGEARFTGVNFGSLKPELGTKLVRVYEDGRQIIPAAREHEDIGFDLHGIQTEPLPSGRTRFYESANPINKLSHCDIAWGLALALFVGEEDAGPQMFTEADLP